MGRFVDLEMTKTELKQIFEKGLDPTFATFDKQTGKLCSFAQLRKNIDDAKEFYKKVMSKHHPEYVRIINSFS